MWKFEQYSWTIYDMVFSNTTLHFFSYLAIEPSGTALRNTQRYSIFATDCEDRHISADHKPQTCLLRFYLFLPFWRRCDFGLPVLVNFNILTWLT